MKKNHNYTDYNVGTGKSYTINQICKILKDISKKEFKIKTSKTKIRKNESLEYQSNSSKLRKLGWKPKISVKEGISKTLKYFEENKM